MEDNSEESETEQESENSESGGSANISCTLGGLQLTVDGDDLEETEEVFERIWEARLQEAGTLSGALRERLVGHQ